MKEPHVFDRKPMKVTVKPGDHYWCSCGKSANQPWCDGSHAGTSFKPLAMSVEEETEAHLCLCKHTQNPGYCDGSHAKLPKESAPELPKAHADSAEVPEEPTLALVKSLARDGLSKTGHHGEMGAMGVPRTELPSWDDLQILTAQLDRKPLLDDEPVDTELVIGPNALKPLVLQTPLFVSDMSFGALSKEAKIAMARGAHDAGTGICSGEGGMLPEEQEANSRYLYELASAKFGYREELLANVQAFHFKAGQGAKTGTGGHLPGAKVTAQIAEVRCLEAGQSAVSPSTFIDLTTPEDFRVFAARVREVTGGIPVGVKMSANHIEKDIQFALDVGVDYIILDGRGGGTGAAPLIFRDHISVPTLPALARARRYLYDHDTRNTTLIITGGLRVTTDFAKALALGADGVAIANSAMQAIGCVAARICNTNNCPAGIATQKEDLRAKLNVEQSAAQLTRFIDASTALMKVLARACGHSRLREFSIEDLTTWQESIARLTGVQFAGDPEPSAPLGDL
jgi:glutamate synthase domain-containing protein 2